MVLEGQGTVSQGEARRIELLELFDDLLGGYGYVDAFAGLLGIRRVAEFMVLGGFHPALNHCVDAEDLPVAVG